MVLERKFIGDETAFWSDLFKVVTLNNGKYVGRRREENTKLKLSYLGDSSPPCNDSSSNTSVQRSMFSWENAILFYELVQSWHYDNRSPQTHDYSDEVYLALFGDSFLKSKQGKTLAKAIDTLIKKHEKSPNSQ